MRKVVLSFLACATLITLIDCKSIKTIEDLDLINLLQNEKERKHVFACMMDQAPCGNMQQFKDSMTEMIRTKCKTCSPQDKERYNMFEQLLSLAYPEKLDALRRKYQTN